MDETTAQFLRSYLVAEGVVRTPAVPDDANGDPPPLWLDPAYGTPQPGDAPDGVAAAAHPLLVVGAFMATAPTAPYEGFVPPTTSSCAYARPSLRSPTGSSASCTTSRSWTLSGA